MILKRLYFKLFSLGDPNWGKENAGKNGSTDNDAKKHDFKDTKWYVYSVGTKGHSA